jgi:hypothetical protein
MMRLMRYILGVFLLLQMCAVTTAQDSLNVRMLGEVHHFVQQSYDVAVFGNHALMASGTASGLRVLDLSDPAAVTEVGYVVNSDTCTDVEIWMADRVVVSGGFAYVLYFDGIISKKHYRLYVYDLSYPPAPQRMGYFSLPDNCTGLFVDGNHAYVTVTGRNGFSGVKIIDVTNPVRPTEAGSFATAGMPEEVYVANRKAYVAVKSALVVYDVSDPASPRLLGSYSPPGGIGLIHHVAVNGMYVCTLDAAFGVRILDASNVSHIQQVGSFPHSQADAHFSHIVISDNCAYYLQDGNITGKMLVILDVSDPKVPTLAGSCSLPGSWSFHGFDYSNGYAYIAGGSHGLRVMDVADPDCITECGCYEPHNLATGLAVSGNHAYVSIVSESSNVLISDPSSPTERSSLSIEGLPKWISASDNYLYVPGAEIGNVPAVRVFDISNPVTPAFVADWLLPPGTVGVPLRVERYQNLVFVATAYGGVQVYDVTRIEAPVALGNWTLWDPISNPEFAVRNVKLSWPYLFVPDESYGLYVLDISDPTNIMEVANHYTPGNAWWVDISPDHDVLYLADFGGGVRIFDVSNPLSPVEVGSIAQNLNHVNRVVAKGDSIYVSDCQGIGLHVYDVSIPGSPEEVAYHRTPGVFGNDIVLANDLIYFLDFTHFEIFEVTGAPTDVNDDPPARLVSDYRIHSVYPNPFNASTRIILELSKPGHIKLQMFNTIGQRVQTLLDDHYQAGRHIHILQADNLASGSYLLRLEANGVIDSRKLTTVK